MIPRWACWLLLVVVGLDAPPANAEDGPLPKVLFVVLVDQSGSMTRKQKGGGPRGVDVVRSTLVPMAKARGAQLLDRCEVDVLARGFAARRIDRPVPRTVEQGLNSCRREPVLWSGAAGFSALTGPDDFAPKLEPTLKETLLSKHADTPLAAALLAVVEQVRSKQREHGDAPVPAILVVASDLKPHCTFAGSSRLEGAVNEALVTDLDRAWADVRATFKATFVISPKLLTSDAVLPAHDTIITEPGRGCVVDGEQGCSDKAFEDELSTRLYEWCHCRRSAERHRLEGGDWEQRCPPDCPSLPPPEDSVVAVSQRGRYACSGVVVHPRAVLTAPALSPR